MCYSVLYKNKEYDCTNELAKDIQPLIGDTGKEIYHDDKMLEADDECLCCVDLKSTAKRHILEYIEDESDPWLVTLKEYESK